MTRRSRAMCGRKNFSIMKLSTRGNGSSIASKLNTGQPTSSIISTNHGMPVRTFMSCKRKGRVPHMDASYTSRMSGSRPRSRRVSIAFIVATVALSACGPLPADNVPRPVAVGRSSDGTIRFVVPLCDGEEISSFIVSNNQTGETLWRVSEPVGNDERSGAILLGEGSGFKSQEVPLRKPLPDEIDVTAHFVSGPPVGSGILVKAIPEDLAGTDQVTSPTLGRGTEKEFLEETESDYC